MYSHTNIDGKRHLNIANFSALVKMDTHVVTGAVYAKCVYIVPVIAEEANFSALVKIDTHVVTGVVYTKCVYTVPATLRQANLSFFSKFLPML